jgi:hypothetical protein
MTLPHSVLWLLPDNKSTEVLEKLRKNIPLSGNKDFPLHSTIASSDTLPSNPKVDSLSIRVFAKPVGFLISKNSVFTSLALEIQLENIVKTKKTLLPCIPDWFLLNEPFHISLVYLSKAEAANVHLQSMHINFSKWLDVPIVFSSLATVSPSSGDWSDTNTWKISKW